MDNSNEGIKVLLPETSVKSFATFLIFRAKKKTAPRAVFFVKLMALFRLHQSKYCECKSENVRSGHFYAKVHD